MKTPTEQHLTLLTLVGTFGYLSTRDCAKLCWPQSEAHSAHVMAQAAVSKLARDEYLLARDLRAAPSSKRTALPPSTGYAKGYVLTTRGADVLNQHWMDEYLDTPLVGDKATLWFADGYNLSLKDHVVRAPVIELCHQFVQRWTRLDPLDPEGGFLHALPVGPRGVARNFLGLAPYAHFDAVLLTSRFEVIAGIYLPAHSTYKSTAEVAKLTSRGQDFLIAGKGETLKLLTRWRAKGDAAMAERVAELAHLDLYC